MWAEPDEMEDIREKTELPVSFLTPQAVPAALQPSQQLGDTASSFKPRRDGGELEISVK